MFEAATRTSFSDEIAELNILRPNYPTHALQILQHYAYFIISIISFILFYNFHITIFVFLSFFPSISRIF